MEHQTGGSGTRIAAGTKAIPTQNIYYADWTPAACTLTLNPNATEGTEAIRYIRDYANGNTINDINHWIENIKLTTAMAKM